MGELGSQFCWLLDVPVDVWFCIVNSNITAHCKSKLKTIWEGNWESMGNCLLEQSEGKNIVRQSVKKRSRLDKYDFSGFLTRQFVESCGTSELSVQTGGCLVHVVFTRSYQSQLVNCSASAHQLIWSPVPAHSRKSAVYGIAVTHWHTVSSRYLCTVYLYFTAAAPIRWFLTTTA